MLRRRNADGPLGANAGSDLVAVPAMHGGGERGDDDLAPLGGGVLRVLLGHERLLRGSTATRQRAPKPVRGQDPERVFNMFRPEGFVRSAKMGIRSANASVTHAF